MVNLIERKVFQKDITSSRAKTKEKIKWNELDKLKIKHNT